MPRGRPRKATEARIQITYREQGEESEPQDHIWDIRLADEQLRSGATIECGGWSSGKIKIKLSPTEAKARAAWRECAGCGASVKTWNGVGLCSGCRALNITGMSSGQSVDAPKRRGRPTKTNTFEGPLFDEDNDQEDISQR